MPSNSKSKMVWYFAYASNLNIFLMMKRVGEWETSQRAYLEGYQLIPNLNSHYWGGYTANIKPTGSVSDKVYGVAYRLLAKKVDVLAHYEGRASTMTKVKLEDGPELDHVKIFMAGRARDKPRAPPPVYVQTILEGLAQHGYARSVVDKVRGILTNP